MQRCCLKTKGCLWVIVLLCRHTVVAKHCSLVSYHTLSSIEVEVRDRKKVYILN